MNHLVRQACVLLAACVGSLRIYLRKTGVPRMAIELLAIYVKRGRNERSGDQPLPELSAELLRRQHQFVAAWPGKPSRPGGLIFTQNPNGSLPPLFWCFQGAREHERLAEFMPDRLIHGMRSRLGGNCAGGLVARAAATQLAACGRKVELLLILDQEHATSRSRSGEHGTYFDANVEGLARAIDSRLNER